MLTSHISSSAVLLAHPHCLFPHTSRRSHGVLYLASQAYFTTCNEFCIDQTYQLFSLFELGSVTLALRRSHCCRPRSDRAFFLFPSWEKNVTNSYFKQVANVVMITNETFPALQEQSQTKLVVKPVADTPGQTTAFFSDFCLPNSNSEGESLGVTHGRRTVQPVPQWHQGHSFAGPATRYGLSSVLCHNTPWLKMLLAEEQPPLLPREDSFPSQVPLKGDG